MHSTDFLNYKSTKRSIIKQSINESFSLSVRDLILKLNPDELTFSIAGSKSTPSASIFSCDRPVAAAVSMLIGSSGCTMAVATSTTLKLSLTLQMHQSI